VTEGEQGVQLTYEVQLIDVSSCSPLTNVYLDQWHCNSTGVYGGIIAEGNGDSSDESNLNATFLRGIQPTDSDGVVTFDTIFPGHYTGRTNHIHVLSHLNATVNTSNNTLATSGNITHVGQIFFDQDLIDQIEATTPYSTNTQNITTNADDYILAQEATDVDPMLEYVLLGSDISDGLFGWIVIGVDASNDFTNITAAATLTADGGVENESSQFDGAPPSNGTA
jgi:protocatechuate 3,4-dioxygenase beta subunit